MNIVNGDILIAASNQIFRIIDVEPNLSPIFIDYIKAIAIINDKAEEVFLFKKDLDSYRNITEELKIINELYKRYYEEDYLIELDGKTIKLDVKSTLKKLEDLKSSFNIEGEIEVNVK
jgi:hypothetical protein